MLFTFTRRLILSTGLNGRSTARRAAAHDAYGNVEFHSFTPMFVPWPTIKRLAEEQEELKVLPALSNYAHCQFQDVVFQVAWGDLGGC